MAADKAIQSGYTKRYLPESAWASMSKEEREETDRKKRAGSREGKQFISYKLRDLKISIYLNKTCSST